MTHASRGTHREDSSDCGGVSTRGHGQREGPDGDKWSKTTQETLGGSGVSEANGVLRNHYYPPSQIWLLFISESFPAASSYTNKKGDDLISHPLVCGVCLLFVVFVFVAVEVGFGVGDLLIEFCLELISVQALCLQVMLLLLKAVADLIVEEFDIVI